MEKKIYYLNPVFEAKYWGGQALRDRYGYNPDIPNIAIAYHVIALPSHKLDNEVVGTGGDIVAVLRESSGAVRLQPGGFPHPHGFGEQRGAAVHPASPQ